MYGGALDRYPVVSSNKLGTCVAASDRGDQYNSPISEPPVNIARS